MALTVNSQPLLNFNPISTSEATAPLIPLVLTKPSKHAESDSHPGQIGWEALARSTDQIRLAKIWHNQPELNRIQADFV